ncbi:MAG: DUF58 domain-containing protein [Nocardioidaceae bacterium]
MSVAAAPELEWVASPLTRRLVTLSFVALILAGLLQNAALVVLATPLLVAVAVLLRRPRAGRLEVVSDVGSGRTFEHEQVTLTARVHSAEPTGSLRLMLRPEEPVAVRRDTVGVALGSRAEATWMLQAGRWGYWRCGAVTVGVRSRGRAWSAEVTVPGPPLTVFPPADSQGAVPRPPVLLSRLGPHVSRAPGSGIEFAGIREHLPGDPVRRVNWRLSSRRGQLMLNEYAQERMGDLVVLIDSISDTGPPGRSTVDLSVRGATGVVHAYLTHADRVGVVAFGSMLRWMTPTTGLRHFYRIVETLLEARQARTYVDPSLDRVPLAVLPSGALVICFSALVDEVVLEAIRDLRQRNHPVVVVDVLSVDAQRLSEPPPDDLAMRIWRLERGATRASLTRIGVSVLSYDELIPGSLDWLAGTPTMRAGRR